MKGSSGDKNNEWCEYEVTKEFALCMKVKNISTLARVALVFIPCHLLLI
jgi:hypothetical protein